jgi:hypothetical protein
MYENIFINYRVVGSWELQREKAGPVSQCASAKGWPGTGTDGYRGLLQTG